MKKLIGLLLLLAAGSSAFAQTYPHPKLSGINGITTPVLTEVWVNASGSDSNAGNSPHFPKLTPAAGLTALSSGGTLHLTGGMFTITAALAPSASTLIECSKGSGITQANGTNLSTLLNFSTNSANDAGIKNCIIDGNVAGQTADLTGNMIFIGAANNVTVSGNTIQNPQSVGVAITDGVNDNVIGNHFTNGTYDNVNLSPTAPQTTNNAHISDNTSDHLGAHFLEMYGSDRDVIDNNVVNGFTVNGIVANVASTTSVTWVSGPNFSTLRAGNFIICGSGANYQELFISKVVSNTSLTIGTSTPGVARTSQNCIAGPGDIMDITGSFLEIGNNTLTGGTTAGIVVNNFLVVENVQQVHVHDNNISNMGDGCLFVQAISNGGAIMVDDSYTGNHLSTCGQGQTPLAAKAAIVIDDGSPTGAVNQWVDGNVEIDNTGNTGYWMSIFGAVQSEVSVGKNTSRGITSAGIYQGIRSVTLSGGWGSTAAVNSFSTNGSSYVVVVTSSGTGQSGSPSITVNKAVGGADSPPMPACNFATSNGTAANAAATGTVNTDTIILDGTPSNGIGYTLTCKE